jgi:basic membrane lipoprotein Med (substrate-binding protein (PBP1-ABC) superfamily)
VGFIYVGAKDDYGYNQAHAEAAAVVKTWPGIKVVEEENVPETTAVQKTMQGMIVQDGAKLLFPTSFGYFDPHVLAMAASSRTSASPTAAACGPRASTRRTWAASSATSTRPSTSTASSPAT